MSFQYIQTKIFEITGEYILPEVDGLTGETLITDGSGNVTWGTGGSGAGTNTLALNRTSGSTLTLDNTNVLSSNPLYLTYDTTTPAFSDGWTYASSTTADSFTCPQTGKYKVTVIQSYKPQAGALAVAASTWYISVSRFWPGSLFKEATEVGSISAGFDTTTVIMQNCHTISKVFQMDAGFAYKVGVYCNSGASIDANVTVAYNDFGNLIFEFIE